MISGNHVNVKWGWGGNSAYLDICEIRVDRGDGKGFVLLAFDTTPGYTDTQPFPAVLVTWTLYYQKTRLTLKMVVHAASR